MSKGITMKQKLTTILSVFLATAFLCIAFPVLASAASEEKIPIKVLLLPKFELGELKNDAPGEAQFYYEEYLSGADEYEIKGSFGGNCLYVKDGIALYVTGMGKVNAAISAMAVLEDDRFDFSEAYIISTGCAGSAVETTVMGDVILVTAAIDYDLGHHADPREMTEESETTWFSDSVCDDYGCVCLDQELMDKVYDLIKDIPCLTTEHTRSYMAKAFPGEDWASRDPMVLRGTTVTADNYWKGIYGHANALLMTETYGCPDPYAVTEMEDMAIARVAMCMGMLDHLIILRDSVNMDAFLFGATPESLWGPKGEDSFFSEDSIETADIFSVAMENNFRVGKVIMDAILKGDL